MPSPGRYSAGSQARDTIRECPNHTGGNGRKPVWPKHLIVARLVEAVQVFAGIAMPGCFFEARLVSRFLLNASYGFLFVVLVLVLFLILFLFLMMLLLFGTGWRGEDERRHRHAVDVLGGHQELLPGMTTTTAIP